MAFLIIKNRFLKMSVSMYVCLYVCMSLCMFQPKKFHLEFLWFFPRRLILLAPSFMHEFGWNFWWTFILSWCIFLDMWNLHLSGILAKISLASSLLFKFWCSFVPTIFLVNFHIIMMNLFLLNDMWPLRSLKVT